MGTLFDDMFSSSWTVLVKPHGETGTVTITPAAVGVGPFTVSAIFQAGRVIENKSVSDPREPSGFGVLLVNPSDVTGWTPAVGDAVSIGSADYAVESVGQETPVLELQIATTDGS